jgi:protein-S-isoprenylcysteine O-methyltransferase Ste14
VKWQVIKERKMQREERCFPPPLVYVLRLVRGYALDRIFPLHALSFDFELVVGLPLPLVGLPLVISALQIFKKNQTAINPTKPSMSLVTEGPYRFSRNPMYLSLILLYPGIAFLNSNLLWSLCCLSSPFSRSSIAT